jgi:aminoglycoside 2''-phosphotransferase
MPNSEALWLQRIRKIMPNLAIEHIEINQDGLINDVIIVNQALVFRFAKTEKFARLLNAEAGILETIRPHVSLEIPAPFYKENGLMVYPLLPGQPLLFEDVLDLHPPGQQGLADQLGRFLHELHSVRTDDFIGDLPATRAYVKREQWLDFRKTFQEKVYPLLQKHQIHWIERLFDLALMDDEFFNYAPALIHGDLAPYHILFSPGETRVCGVIDFGMAGLGDPASDFGILISIYGENFVSKMGSAYPNLESQLPRARFYAQSIELEWVLRGIESGEDFWFTAHLGGARDVRQ